MLAKGLVVDFSRQLFGRRFISSRGNHVLPLTCYRQFIAVGIFTRPLTSTEGVLRTEEPKLQVQQCFGISQSCRSSQSHHKSCEHRLFQHKGSIFHRDQNKFNMPALKGKRSESFRELILGKKKDKKSKEGDKEETKANGDLPDGEHEETGSLEATSPGSTGSDPAKDAESNVVENGNDDEETQAGEEPETIEEALVEEEPEPEPEPEGGGIYLGTLVKKLESFAPLSLAEDWDNVGLLVEPAAANEVKKVFLTNDLTEAVLEEAIEKGSNFILSYHPPIFAPLKRLTAKSEKERIILKAIENGVAIYSPHTAHDAVKGGVNDWLLSAFGEQNGFPLTASDNASIKKYRLEVAVKKPHKQKTASLFTADNGSLSRPKDKIEKTSDSLYHFKAICTKATLVDMLSTMNEMNIKRINTQITKLYTDPCGETGMGRQARLKAAVTLEEAVTKVKEHLGLEHVQLALGNDKTMESSIETVAVCAGSGGKVLAASSADLFLTGEMSHHEILAAVAKGTSVILCNHSNTARGYLKELKSKLENWFPVNIAVHISSIDADPLKAI